MTKKTITAIIFSLMAVSVGGCSSSAIWGLGSSDYSCPAPKGDACRGVSSVYDDGAASAASADEPSAAAPVAAAPPKRAIPQSGAPLLHAPRLIRLWVAPFEDENGDLHDQQFVYVVIDFGEWNLPRAPFDIGQTRR